MQTTANQQPQKPASFWSACRVFSPTSPSRQDIPTLRQWPCVLTNSLWWHHWGKGSRRRAWGRFRARFCLPIQGDHILRAPFHSEYLRDALQGSQVQFNSKLVGHHFGFITPFPKWLTDQETIPIAMDPLGFDQTAFISEANRSIASFF